MVNDWDAAWVDDTVITGATGASNGLNMTAGSNIDGDAISNDGKDGTAIAVTVTNGAGTSVYGLEVYICAATGGAGVMGSSDPPYEDHNTAWGVQLPKDASTTYTKVIFVPGSVGAFRVRVRNPTGSGITMTAKVRRRQAATA